MEWDLVVVGAGAAGLLAAARAAERGVRTLLVEKNRRPGIKILMSGGTRCNLTQATDRRGIIREFGTQGNFLQSALAALAPQDLVDWFESEGVATKVEATGKVFPVSDKAADVLDALVRRLTRSGCTLALDEPLVDAEPIAGDGFRLTTSKRSLLARKLLVTTGGQSYPGCGTTGDGYRFAAKLGHTIVYPRPALTPVTTDAPWVRALQGVTIPDVAVAVVESAACGTGDQTAARRSAKSGRLAKRRGSFLFTHFGLSGPTVLDVSRVVSGHANPRSLVLECDFLPNLTGPALDEWLRREAAAAGGKHLVGLMVNQLPRRLSDALLVEAGLSPEHRAAELSRAQRARWVTTVKRAVIPVSGTRGFKKAEVTAGGVSLDEVDSSTMQSRLVPNLYVAGEVLDLDGPIGGYNFQAAFSSGWLAAESV
ncbi:MAG TPA: NAD(P)/FAD-dependent oxidoreductase [Pirellulales bacterium]|nr:NAD(P)/FAD-dependent oxidoreductase [Pirellulales bacterium]